MVSSSGASPVIVAFDGSPESQAALTWAIDFARLRGHRLRIVTALRPSLAPTSDSAGGYLRASDPALHQSRNRSRRLARGPLDASGVEYEHLFGVGSITRLLRACSHDATVAAIGTRPTTGLARFVRRSTTNQLIGKLDCPVVSISATPPALAPTMAGSPRNDAERKDTTPQRVLANQ